VDAILGICPRATSCRVIFSCYKNSVFGSTGWSDVRGKFRKGILVYETIPELTIFGFCPRATSYRDIFFCYKNSVFGSTGWSDVRGKFRKEILTRQFLS